MPGVPHEMKAMWEGKACARCCWRGKAAPCSLTLRVLGGGEAIWNAGCVRCWETRIPPPPSIARPVSAIRITARAQSDTGHRPCAAPAKKFYDLLGDAVYDEDITRLEETGGHRLQANGLKSLPQPKAAPAA